MTYIFSIWLAFTRPCIGPSVCRSVVPSYTPYLLPKKYLPEIFAFTLSACPAYWMKRMNKWMNEWNEWNEWINEWMNEMKCTKYWPGNPFCKKTRLFILTNLWKRKALSISTSNVRFDDDDDDDGDNIEDIEPLKRHGGTERRRKRGTDVRMDRQSDLQRCVSRI